MAASKSRSRSSSSSSKSSSSSRARGASASRGSASRGSSSRGGSSRGSGGGGRSGSSGAAQVTTDHDQIRQWAEARGGKPACVKGTQRGKSCLLRIDFPGGAGAEKLEPMEWDEFFEQLDKSNLQFLYQDKTKGGRTSRFNKFVSPETAAERGSRSRSRGRDAR